MPLLLDEHFSEQDAAQVRQHNPSIYIVSLHAWERGAYLAHDDAAILAEAYRQGRTLVTRDVRTIPPLLVVLAQAGTSHGGVIFVDHARVIAPAREVARKNGGSRPRYIETGTLTSSRRAW